MKASHLHKQSCVHSVLQNYGTWHIEASGYSVDQLVPQEYQRSRRLHRSNLPVQLYTFCRACYNYIHQKEEYMNSLRTAAHRHDLDCLDCHTSLHLLIPAHLRWEMSVRLLLPARWEMSACLLK